MPKLADTVAAATVTDDGTVKSELVLVSETAAPPAGPAPLRVTVQVELPPEATLAGEHCKPETVGSAACTEMAPPVPATSNAVPSASDPIGFPKERVTGELLVADRVTVATATTPLPMALA